MMRASSLLRLGLSTLLLLAPLAGCQLVLGIGGELPLGEGGGGAGGTGGMTTASGGAGGTGTSVGGSCTPDEVTDCYTGEKGTEGVGACKPGKATCMKEGVWGPCAGEVVPAVEMCATTDDESCDGLDCTTWVKTILGAVYGSTVGVDAQGNIVVGVVFTEGIDLGDGNPVLPVGNSDIALLKYDSKGTLIWEKVFPGADGQSLDALAVDAAGNIAIAGVTYGTLDLGKGALPLGGYVAKLDPSGTALWSVSAHSAAGPAGAQYLALDTKGNVLVGGNGGAIDLGSGLVSSDHGQAFWLGKLDKDSGAAAWVKITTGGQGEYITGLVVDTSDSPVLTGSWKGTYLGLSPNDLFNNTGNDAIFLLRLDPDGKKSNAKMIAGQNSGFMGGTSGIDVDKFGWASMVGGFSGPIQFNSGSYDGGQNGGAFVVRDQTTSFMQWSHAYVPMEGYINYGLVAVDGSDNIVTQGSYDGKVVLAGNSLPLGPGAFVLKLDKEGNELWARTYTFGDGGIQGMTAGSFEDETLLVGTFYGSADLGTGVINAPQGYFLARLGK